MLCTCLGHTKAKTYHLTSPNMGGSKNEPIEVSFREANFEWKIVKVVDLIGII